MFRAIVILFLTVCLAYFASACAVQQPAGAPTCGASAELATLQASGCDAASAYVLTCAEPIANPGLEGACQPPQTGALGISREVKGRAGVWCCK